MKDYKKNYELICQLLENSDSDTESFFKAIFNNLMAIYDITGAGIMACKSDYYTISSSTNIPDDLLNTNFSCHNNAIKPEVSQLDFLKLPDHDMFLVLYCTDTDDKLDKGELEDFIKYFSDILTKKKNASREKIYLDYFSNSPAFLFKLDINGVLIEANNACREVLGYTSTENGNKNNIVGYCFSHFTAPNDIEIIRTKFNNLYNKAVKLLKDKKKKEDKRFNEIITEIKKMNLGMEPLKLCSRKGDILTFNVDAHLLIDEKGWISGFYCTAFDLSEIKSIENKLIQTEERYKLLYKLLPIYSILIDANMKIIEFNNKFSEAWGDIPIEGELSTIDVVYKEDHPKGVQLFVRLYNAASEIKKMWKDKKISREECYSRLRNERIIEEELRFIIKGQMYYISINASLWFDIDTFEIKGILATAIDTSDYKMLEQKLIESERKYREIVEEKTSDIIFSCDKDGRFITANKNMYKKLGFTEDDLIGKNISEIIYNDPNNENEINSTIVDANTKDVLLNGGKSVIFKATCSHNSLGEKVTLQFKLDAIQENGNVTGLVGFATEPLDDPLLKYLIKSDCAFEMDNSLVIANEISFRLTRDLPKFLKSSNVNLIRMGLSEMIINAIEHGNLEITYEDKAAAKSKDKYVNLLRERISNPNNLEKKVYIDSSIFDECVKFTIRDQGSGFNYKEFLEADLDDTDDNFLACGRGIMAAQAIFDKIEYNESGNEVTLVKYFE